MPGLLEKSILESLSRKSAERQDEQTRVDEADKGGEGARKDELKDKSGKVIKRQAADLAKLGKQYRIRKGKPRDPKRAKAMKKVWKTKRKAMMRGWVNRKKLYGSAQASTAMQKMYGILNKYTKESAMEIRDYEQVVEQLMNILYGIIAEKVSRDEVYESLVFDVCPIVTIIEAIADREMKVTEQDAENIQSFLTYVDEEILNEQEESEEGSEETDESAEGSEENSEESDEGSEEGSEEGTEEGDSKDDGKEGK